jgi:hypothetical protein
MNYPGSDPATIAGAQLRLIVMVVVTLLCPRAAHAQVTRLEIVSREPANNGQPVGRAGAYEVLRGLIHGEVDPADSHNTIIQDLPLAPPNARGRVEYVATFALARPVDLAKASGMLVYQVVNRGNGTVTPTPDGDISLVSGWQADVAPTAANQTITVPVAINRDGSPVTGPMIARFSNVPPGTNTVAIRLSSMGSGPPVYPPATLDERSATLTMHAGEAATGVQTRSVVVPRDGWAFADCRTTPFPGAPDATRLSDTPRRMRRGRPTQSPARSRTRSASEIRSRATSSRRSSISGSIRISRGASSGTACFRGSPRGKRR